MSATNRGAVRRESDYYPTPGWCVDLVLNEFAVAPRSVAEPCKGCGAIYGRLPEAWPAAEWAEIRQGRDFFNVSLDAQLHITNPPFSIAEQFLRKSLEEAETVIYLLRLNFLGSQKRKPLFTDFPPSHLFVLPKRPSFMAVCKGRKAKHKHAKACGRTYPAGARGECVCGGLIGDGTDATEYAWFAWDRAGLLKRPPGVYVA